MTHLNDYTLTISDVSQRLGKSARTIHRYKSSGRLSFVVGATQGAPLYFSRSEVERLASELLPAVAASASLDPQFWARLERAEHLLAALQRNPALEQILQLTQRTAGQAMDPQTMDALLDPLVALGEHGGVIDSKALGALLVRLGTALLNS